MDIVFIGAGRLATNLARGLHGSGHRIVQVFSRTMESAQQLAEQVEATHTDSIDALATDADAYIVAVKDSVLTELALQLAEVIADRPVFHTAGSMPMSVFSKGFRHYGVIYPMQTFSKERVVDLSRVPFFIEASTQEALSMANSIAATVSSHVHEMSGEQRRYLHLAAVFACNFANHCYALSAEVLEQHGIPFEVMLPLIDETAQKVATMAPRLAQTGPAVRYDENVMNAHLQLLQDNQKAQQVYRLMSESVHELSLKDNDKL